jgi:hypothetical protein
MLPLPARAPAERKPMSAARRVSLFEREIRVRLAAPAVDILLDVAESISEGQLDGRSYFGSTFLTIDLARAGALVSGPCDASAARRVAELVGADERVLTRVRELASAQAIRRAGATLARIAVDVRVRSAGTCVHLDADVEGSLP